jgi:uncharacterized protein YdeI (YjbR/CyaY-like superfamily)
MRAATTSDSPLVRLVARGPRNVGHIARLDVEGRLLPAGRAAVEAAQADGRWEAAYAGPATATVPDDFATAIAADPKARAQFAALTSQNRFAFIYRLGTVKTAKGRARKIETFVDLLARGELFHPQKNREVP